MRRSIAILLLLLLVLPALAQDEPAPHKPDYGPALHRKLVPVEFTFRDAAGEPVRLDHHASAGKARFTRIAGDYRWTAQCWVDALGGKVFGGSTALPGLEPGEYLFEADLGYYGQVQNRITVAAQVVRKTLRTPHSRKVITLKYVDNAGNPLKVIPAKPRFDQEVKRLGNPEIKLPSPVLRLPPARDRGGGAVMHRRARRGGITNTLTDKGKCLLTVFDGGGNVIVPLSEKWFGKESVELPAPFDKAEYDVRVAPSDAWKALDVDELKVWNADDPGLRHFNSRQSAAVSVQQQPHKVTMTMSPTVRAWARFGTVMVGFKDIGGRYAPGCFEFAKPPEEIGGVNFAARDSSEAIDLDYVRQARFKRNELPKLKVFGDATGATDGTFFRVVGHTGEPIPFCEATVMPLDDDKLAQAMRAHEQTLSLKNARPPAPETLDIEVQDKLAEAAEEEDEALVAREVGDAAFDNLQKREYRLRYAKYGAWYDSHHRMDGDEDGYVIAPHVVLEKGELYVLYIWGPSRDDLKPDLRLVVRGEGDTTDFGVIRLPK
jgi:hypothetical protein